MSRPGDDPRIRVVRVKPLVNWHLLAYSELSATVYSDDNRTIGNGMTLPNDWRVVNTFSNGLFGFKAVLYFSSSTGDAVLAFRGSQLAMDTFTDIAQWLGDIPPSYSLAVDTVRRLKKDYGDRLTLTGHSLGGGLAMFAGTMTGTRTVTFNAAGLGWGARVESMISGVRNASALIDNYVIRGEVVTYTNIPLVASRVGRRHDLSVFGDPNMFARHSILNFVQAFLVDASVPLA